jgi:hypothetical protein
MFNLSQSFFGAPANLQFDEIYQCYSMAVSGRDLEDGDKILLPQSALEILARFFILLFFLLLLSLVCSHHLLG